MTGFTRHRCSAASAGQARLRRQALRRCRLAEQDFAQIVLQQELFGDAQRLEHPLDVAVEQRPLLASRGGVRPVLQGLAIDDDVLRVGRRPPRPAARSS